MDHRSVLRVTRYINKRTLRLLAALGVVTAGCIAVISCLGAVLMVRQLRLISAQRKALPVLQRAAEVYLEKNGENVGRKKSFFHPKATTDIAVVPLDEEAEESENRE